MNAIGIADTPMHPTDDSAHTTPGITYHQWLVGQFAASLSGAWHDDDGGWVLERPDIVTLAFDIADDICREYAKRDAP